MTRTKPEPDGAHCQRCIGAKVPVEAIQRLHLQPVFDSLDIDGTQICEDCALAGTVLRLNPDAGLVWTGIRLAIAEIRIGMLRGVLVDFTGFGPAMRRCTPEELRTHHEWLRSEGFISDEDD